MNRQNEKNNVKTYLKYLDSSIPHSIANFKLYWNKLIFMYLKHIAHHIKTISILKWDKLTSNIFNNANAKYIVFRSIWNALIYVVHANYSLVQATKYLYVYWRQIQHLLIYFVYTGQTNRPPKNIGKN